MKGSKSQLPVSVCIALLISTSFYLLLTYIGDGSPAIPEQDSRIYLHYARNIAQGHPYVYSLGDYPSTGSTSYLYPLILALLYKIGATGDAFITATYALNAFFYLGIIAMTWCIAKKFESRAAPFAISMVLFSGQIASAVLRMTDIGLFTLLALSLSAALLYSRYRLALLCAFLCALARPEGFIFAIAFLFCGTIFKLLSARKLIELSGPDRHSIIRYLLNALIGICGFSIILFLNLALTGHAEFMSVAEKGYFNIYPFFGAMAHTIKDLLLMLHRLIFSMGVGQGPYYTFPVLGGLFGLAGIFIYRRNKAIPMIFEFWLLLSAGAALLLIASSEWQGVSHDRYLTWLMPFWYIYIAIGLQEIAQRLKSARFAYTGMTLMIGFQFITMGYFVTDAYTVSVQTEREKRFCETIRGIVSTQERFGSVDASLLNFYLPEHKVYNILGITAPDFFDPDSRQQIKRFIDLLRNRPELRFENWLIASENANTEGWLSPFIGNPVAVDTDSTLAGAAQGYGVYQADWSTLDGGDFPVLLALNSELGLKGKLDVGYLPDERAYQYHRQPRMKNVRIPMMITTATLGEQLFSENGRVVFGSESFVLSGLDPGSDLWIAWRTSSEAEQSIFLGDRYLPACRISLNPQQHLRMFVDGREIPAHTTKLSETGFSELLFRIPSEYIRTSTPLIEFSGDHISYAFWFYQ